MIKQLQKNEINLVTGGKRCFSKSVYDVMKKFTEASGVAVCLVYAGVRRGGDHDHPPNIRNIFMNPEVRSKALCSLITVSSTAFLDFWVGDWFECN